MTDYEATRRSFRLRIPPDFSYTRDVVGAWAASHPEKVALVAVGPGGQHRRELTFADLWRASNRVANALAGLGAAPGERAFVMLPRIPEWHEVMLGMASAGVVLMPATVQCTPNDVAYRVGRAEATIAVTDTEGAVKVAEALPRCPALRHLVVVGEPPGEGWRTFDELVAAASDRPPALRPTSKDDPLLIYFTSGTVSYPKMVLHTHASCGAGHEITARFWQDLTPRDLHWTISDTGWAKAAWGKLFGQWRLGAAVFLWDQRGKFDAELCLRILERSGVTTFCAPPTLYRTFVHEELAAFDLSRIRHAMSAGEPLNPAVIERWRAATSLTIYDGYGQSETVSLVANYRCLPVREGSMGKPTPTFDVDVVDEEGGRLLPGVEGHIAVRTDPERPVGLMAGYWRDEAANAEAFHDGWYFTGDRARRDEDGYLWFVGRADDVITSGAYRIGPFEVESALIAHPAVAESAVVGKPDPERTEIVKAFVVLAPGWEPSDALVRELQAHVKRVTAPYKYPREIEFVDELPKTVSGKIRRVALRQMEQQRALEAAGAAASRR